MYLIDLGRPDDIAVLTRSTPSCETLFRSDLPARLSAPYAIAIPARNEESRVLPCLRACLTSMQYYGRLGVIVLLINNTTDRTAELAVAWAKEVALPIEIISAVLPSPLAHVGFARRLAMDRARCFLPEIGVLLTTDADSLPEQAWISENLRQLSIPQALVCGRIEFDCAEVAALPSGTLERGNSETYYKSLAFELDGLLDPDPLNPWPHHGQTSGASLAMRAFAYDRIGGLPVVPSGEDRALARAFRENDMPVLYRNSASVITSCRPLGRAAGGMAETISLRAGHENFVCDELLEEADQLFRRATLRSRLRVAMNSDDMRSSTINGLGLTKSSFQQASKISGFGALWSFLERESPILRRTPMFRLHMEKETPRLRALVNGVRAKQPSSAQVL